MLLVSNIVNKLQRRKYKLLKEIVKGINDDTRDEKRNTKRKFKFKQFTNVKQNVYLHLIAWKSEHNFGFQLSLIIFIPINSVRSIFSLSFSNFKKNLIMKNSSC